MTTPLALSIKRQFPEARVEYLVFQGTEGVLAKNPWIDRVHTMPRVGSGWQVLKDLCRKFDVALATTPSDRTALAAILAGKKSVGLCYGVRKEWWKRVVFSSHRLCDDRKHVVPVILSLLEPLGILAIPEVVMGYDADDAEFSRSRLPATPYVLLHPYSRGACKYWPAASWGELAGRIGRESGYVPVFTVTGDFADREYLDTILGYAPAGCLILPEPFTLPQLAAAIRGSAAYVGIDTVVTHMAAAVGARTIALFGPTLTRYWAPWPNGSPEDSPFSANRGVQRNGNITVMQQNWPCVPCNRENCATSSRGGMECLEELGADAVFTELARLTGKEE